MSELNRRRQLGLFAVAATMSCVLLASTALSQAPDLDPLLDPLQIDERTSFASYSIKHVLAEEISGHLDKILGADSERFRFTVVHANNSIVVAGSDELLKKVEEIIKLLDKPDLRPPELRRTARESALYQHPGDNTSRFRASILHGEDLFDTGAMIDHVAVDQTTSAHPTIGSDELSAELSKAELEVERQAAMFRREAQNGSPNTARLDKLREGLKERVNQAFDVRQQVQRQQLQALQQRVGRIANRLKERDDLREEIVNRRLESLLETAAPASQ